MAKREREFFPVGDVPWTPAVSGTIPGLYERILATDPHTGAATRILMGVTGGLPYLRGALRRRD